MVWPRRSHAADSNCSHGVSAVVSQQHSTRIKSDNVRDRLRRRARRESLASLRLLRLRPSWAPSASSTSVAVADPPADRDGTAYLGAVARFSHGDDSTHGAAAASCGRRDLLPRGRMRRGRYPHRVRVAETNRGAQRAGLASTVPRGGRVTTAAGRKTRRAAAVRTWPSLRSTPARTRGSSSGSGRGWQASRPPFSDWTAPRPGDK